MIDPKTRRGDVPAEYTWDLADLYENDEAWRTEYDALRGMPERAAACRGTLGESAAGCWRISG